MTVDSDYDALIRRPKAYRLVMRLVAEYSSAHLDVFKLFLRSSRQGMNLRQAIWVTQNPAAILETLKTELQALQEPLPIS
ncbi:hypothetical protein [Deinococcus hohokamensis]|uniref:Transposase n=1 Tax=Deinococcus hohokamensis TaxID=309883 RepID=A0ABV9I5V8_9DEIO